jgi:uncharacterized protein (DUF433 family)
MRYSQPMAATTDIIVRAAETHGTPVFRGTRVPVKALFDTLEAGETLEEFLEGFPTVSREMAVAALEQAHELLAAKS